MINTRNRNSIQYYNNDRALFETTLKQFNKLSIDDLRYLAGFVDGDGSIIMQIVTRRTGLKFNLQGTLTFHQLQVRGNWFFPLIHDCLNHFGRIEQQSSGMGRLVISAQQEVSSVLILLFPFLVLKQRQAKYALDILLKLPDAIPHNLRSRAASLPTMDPKAFLALCRKALLRTRFEFLNDSKRRSVTSETVLASFKRDNLL
jgi:hypothetical protein